MATRSWIGIKEKDKIEVVYCHNDGYPSNQEPLLKNNYKNKSYIQDLLLQGCMSSLGPDIENCVFYHRDIGEKLAGNESCIFDRLEDAEGGCDYMYLFENNKWDTYEYDYKNNEWNNMNKMNE